MTSATMHSTVLRVSTVTHVLPAENKTTPNLVRYMPTLGVILMGYFFKKIASDMKKVTPWAILVASDSAL
ncbi:hypothetical protein BJY04DRAFT_191707 [Aspergillus karnatakaensis]|uniref:uncharacterized protein n=1 Tax=Aspergillus karnatakaensis TaxID=1810916 RepID=UPI003CCC9357